MTGYHICLVVGAIILFAAIISANIFRGRPNMKYIVGFFVGLLIALITYAICLSDFVLNRLYPILGNDAAYAVGLVYGPLIAIGAGIVGFIVTVLLLGTREAKKDSS